MAADRQANRGGGSGPGTGPAIGVYTGAGSSHSWLWFVETFERMGLWDLRFVDHRDIISGGLDGLDALAVSGGDTFAIAGGLGPAGARALADFVTGGGVYLGSCAGAYLFLRSSKEPLSYFNLTDARISNLADALPDARALPEKFSTAYGCRYVFHPVRESVELVAEPDAEFSGAGRFPAPLYGGPAMVEAPGTRVLARYAGFTEGTMFLADEGLAGTTLLGRAAALAADIGRGRLYLFGPHLEHPQYPEANELVRRALCDARQTGGGLGEDAGHLDPVRSRGLLRDIKREVSNCRVVAWGMRDAGISWRIGHKVYDPAKIREFLARIWPRLLLLERSGGLILPGPRIEGLPGRWREVTTLVRGLRHAIDDGADGAEQAARLLPALSEAAALFMELYFASRSRGRETSPVRAAEGA